MEKKIILTSKENKELEEYCKLNSLNIDKVIKGAYTQGIKIEMYGLLNSDQPTLEVQEKIVEKEVVKYVEVVKEVEVPKIEYVEVPVEVTKEVIKEVVVEKQQDNSKQKALEATLHKLKIENIEKDKKIKELQDTISQLVSSQVSNQGTYLRGSNLKDKLF